MKKQKRVKITEWSGTLGESQSAASQVGMGAIGDSCDHDAGRFANQAPFGHAGQAIL
jgi:hypothetical protein